MSDPDDRYDAMLARLLAGAPPRVIDSMAQGDAALLRDIDDAAEALASLGLALDPVAPSDALRERVAAMAAGLTRGHGRAAVVVVDMMIDHLTPGMPLEVPRARAIVPAMKARLDAARSRGEPVVYLCDHHAEGDPDLLQWPEHNVGDPAANVWGEIAPREGDVVIPHRGYSGFYATELESVLRGLSVDSLVVTGCITEMHVFATACDALQRGFAVTVPVELQAGSSEAVERVVLGTLAVMRPVPAVGL